jgi:large subunit ribosomal protein L6
MSRIGKKPVSIPSGVKVSIADRTVTVENKGQTLSFDFRPEVSVTVDEEAKAVVVDRVDDERVSKAMHGLTRSIISNMITGVTEGYTKDLEVHGAGWTAKMQGQNVALNVGYADTKMVAVPPGVKVEIQQNKIKVSGADKQAVGQIAAESRAGRKHEPYNGKVIKYADERIIRKQGKQFGS